jgi:hypothetical protein
MTGAKVRCFGVRCFGLFGRRRRRTDTWCAPRAPWRSSSAACPPRSRPRRSPGLYARTHAHTQTRAHTHTYKARAHTHTRRAHGCLDCVRSSTARDVVEGVAVSAGEQRGSILRVWLQVRFQRARLVFQNDCLAGPFCASGTAAHAAYVRACVRVRLRARACVRVRLRARACGRYERLFANPLTAARRGFIDDIILPRVTRKRLCQELDALYNKVLAVDPPHTHVPVSLPLHTFRPAMAWLSH